MNFNKKWVASNELQGIGDNQIKEAEDLMEKLSLKIIPPIQNEFDYERYGLNFECVNEANETVKSLFEEAEAYRMQIFDELKEIREILLAKFISEHHIKEEIEKKLEWVWGQNYGKD